MKIRTFALLLCMVPCVASADVRDGSARLGVERLSMVAPRGIAMAAKNVGTGSGNTATQGGNTGGGTVVPAAVDCRAAYRECMDEFCLLSESEGERCACSDNINKSKDLIKEIQQIQAEADVLYNEGVKYESLGAKASLVFGQTITAWLNNDDAGDDDGLGADDMIGSGLYAAASEYCAGALTSCRDKAEMEELLYSRQIVADCKSFESYLAEQKVNALANKRTAEAAVRNERLNMLDTTNKYNRGECLLAYKSCIADKGGCGSNFENCLDVDLLGRRANACENVLDQCMAVRDLVRTDWDAEAQSILADAAKYVDTYKRQNCFARIQDCLEQGCSTETNTACLTNVEVAAGVCPVINECEVMIPGMKDSVNAKLGYLRTQFCQNDVDKCLRNKCGENFNAPECIGKSTTYIAKLCPQTMFPSCKGETQFNIIVQATLLQMDYQLMQGCLNYFGEQLGRACGTDMSCLPSDSTVESLVVVPDTKDALAALRKTVRDNAATAVDDFFKQFEKDKTVAACKDSQKPADQQSLGDSVFSSAKLVANISAQSRALRALETKIAELSRTQDIETARQNCMNTYAIEKPNSDKKNYTYIRSVAFEPALRNCHVCRVQQVCETGGESERSSALKASAGGASGGAAIGTMVSPGWGTLIGGVVGAVGTGLVGMASGGEQEFCQEIESCEDVNM